MHNRSTKQRRAAGRRRFWLRLGISPTPHYWYSGYDEVRLRTTMTGIEAATFDAFLKTLKPRH